MREFAPPILKYRHDPSIRQCLDSVARNVEMPGTVLHHDEKLGRVGCDTMLCPVQGTTVENCITRFIVRDAARHDVIVPSSFPVPV